MFNLSAAESGANGLSKKLPVVAIGTGDSRVPLALQLDNGALYKMKLTY